MSSLTTSFRLLVIFIILCSNYFPQIQSEKESDISLIRLPSEEDKVFSSSGGVCSKSVVPNSCPVNCFRTDPVCGADGVTYWCGCADAYCAGIKVAKLGFCEVAGNGPPVSGQALLLVHIVWLLLLGFSVLFGYLMTSFSISVSQIPLSVRSFTHLTRVRPLVALTELRNRFPSTTLGGLKCLSTNSSMNDPQPNWNNRPPKETNLLDGCDFEHWLIFMEKPQGEPTRDEIIDSYINTLSKVIGSEDEARMKIYSVSTKHYFAFGALVSEEISYKIKELPGVRWVLPDCYLNVREKDYGGEPFIDGKAVPYDPKYHEEWVRNNAQANVRSRRNDRPRYNDRSRNFERRRENMQSRDFQPNQPGSPSGGMPHNPSMRNPEGMPPNRNMQNPGPNMGGMPPNSNMQNPGQNIGGMPPNGNMHPNMGGPPGVNMQPNMGGMQHNVHARNNMGGMPPNANMRGPPSPNADSLNNGGQYRAAPPQGGGAPYQVGPPRDFNPNGNYQ